MSEDEKKLLEEVKLYLNITWDDEATDKNLSGTIKRGMARIMQIAGDPSLDFMQEDLPKHLLLDYCRYSNSHALESFEENFRSQLISLNFMCKVRRRKENETE